MSIQDFSKKRITVLGAGISGRSAALALARHGAEVTLSDMKEHDLQEEPWTSLVKEGVICSFGHQDESLLDEADIIVPSPVISPETRLLKAASARQIPVWSEVEVAVHVTDAEFIGITGTNGKTTTTVLTGEIMKATGRQTVVGGNIGFGLSETAEDLPSSAVVVAELSSFQLELTSSLKAKSAVILNLTPDHLDRHHTMEAYGEAKKRIFLNQDKNDYAILNYDDSAVCAMAPDLSGTVLYISVQIGRASCRERVCLYV